MSYKVVYVYDGDGTYIGATIHREGSQKLHTANLWTESAEDVADLKDQLDRLRDDLDVRSFWPDVRDPEVVALLDNPEWEKLKLSPIEVVDEERSTFIWLEEPSDENPHGRADSDRTILVYKTEYAPAPVDVQARVKKACETVARQRANQI